MIHESTRLLGKDLVENYANWKPGLHTLNNTESGRMLWTANGFSFLDYWPEVGAFNFIEKMWLWRRVKTCLALGAIATPPEEHKHG